MLILNITQTVEPATATTPQQPPPLAGCLPPPPPPSPTCLLFNSEAQLYGKTTGLWYVQASEGQPCTLHLAGSEVGVPPSPR